MAGLVKRVRLRTRFALATDLWDPVGLTARALRVENRPIQWVAEARILVPSRQTVSVACDAGRGSTTWCVVCRAFLGARLHAVKCCPSQPLCVTMTAEPITCTPCMTNATGRSTVTSYVVCGASACFSAHIFSLFTFGGVQVEVDDLVGRMEGLTSGPTHRHQNNKDSKRPTTLTLEQ